MTSSSGFCLSVTDAAGRLQAAEAPSVLEAVAALGRRHRLPEVPRWTPVAAGTA